jgi:putative proteasome-type protease
MTYCCGILVRDGLVMIADTRTNAGLDNVSTFRKLHVFSKPGERIMAVASAGNLAISQSVLSTLTEGLENPDTGELETLLNAPTMFQAAQRIGRAIRSVHNTEGIALKSEDISFDVSFLFGGQIAGSRMRLFMVYPAGNFIECTTDTPYLQIGEHKYGKPVLDRAMHYDVELYEALKTGLISMDSTMRSNLGVGLPIDILVVRTDVCDADLNHRMICAHAGRQRCARRTRIFQDHPTRQKHHQKPRRQETNDRGCKQDRGGDRRRHRRRTRRVAGADEGRLHRGARRAAHGDAGGDPQTR